MSGMHVLEVCVQHQMCFCYAVQLIKRCFTRCKREYESVGFVTSIFELPFDSLEINFSKTLNVLQLAIGDVWDKDLAMFVLAIHVGNWFWDSFADFREFMLNTYKCVPKFILWFVLPNSFLLWCVILCQWDHLMYNHCHNHCNVILKFESSNLHLLTHIIFKYLLLFLGFLQWFVHTCALYEVELTFYA